MAYAYFPGCSLKASAKPYDNSMRFVFKTLGLELVELDDWNCCGATYYMSTKETISLVISARNLAIAERQRQDVVAPCSSCYTILYKTNQILKNNSIMREKVNQALRKDDLEYNLSVNIRHPLEVLVKDVGIKPIAAKAQASLDGIKIAPYYGCQIVRPERNIDNKENPQMMDSLFLSLGADIVYFPVKVRCCGGMLMTTYPDVGFRLNKEILECAQENGANIIATTCPLCQINLEAYQDKINKRYKTNFRLPVLFFTQVLGVALGGKPEQLGLPQNLIPFQNKIIALESTR